MGRYIEIGSGREVTRGRGVGNEGLLGPKFQFEMKKRL